MLAKIKELHDKALDYLNMYEGMIQRLNHDECLQSNGSCKWIYTEKDISTVEAGIKRLKYSYQKTLCKILEL